ncbi:hypothetical protein [Streptomyces sp. NPDC000878]
MRDGTYGTYGPPLEQVERISRLEAFLLYSSTVLLGLCGPVMLACTYFAGAPLLLGGVLCTVLCAPLGLGLFFHAQVEKENNRRLDAFGVQATAEVTEVTPWEDADDSGTAVGLRVSGPGFRTFEATWRRAPHSAQRVGLRLDAVVDRAHGLFRIEVR